MRTSEGVVLVYFVYLLVAAWFRPLPPARRWRVAIAAVCACGIVGVTAAVGPMWFRDWMPLAYVLAGYRLSGLFFVTPALEFEAHLAAADRRLFAGLDLPRRLEQAPRLVLEYLEAVYFATPAFLPAGLVVVLWAGRPDLVEWYWTTVLLAEFGAFAVLPWVPTRPPWMIEPVGAIDRRHLSVRRFSRRVSGPLVIGWNTFPSGHASGALAISIAVFAASPAAGVVGLMLTLSVVVASVVGRYHYGPDAAAGLALGGLAALVAELLVR